MTDTVQSLPTMGGSMTFYDQGLSTKQAAERLGVGDATVRNLIAAGELRSIKIRGRRIVPLSAVIDYLSRDDHQ